MVDRVDVPRFSILSYLVAMHWESKSKMMSEAESGKRWGSQSLTFSRAQVGAVSLAYASLTSRETHHSDLVRTEIVSLTGRYLRSRLFACDSSTQRARSASRFRTVTSCDMMDSAKPLRSTARERDRRATTPQSRPWSCRFRVLRSRAAQSAQQRRSGQSEYTCCRSL